VHLYVQPRVMSLSIDVTMWWVSLSKLSSML
jgi:hypothetical protein